MVSGSGKTVCKMASENCQKLTKNMKLSTIFGGFPGLSNPSYQFSEATFQEFLSFNFGFGTYTPGGSDA